MTVLEANNCVYDNAIEERFCEYFDNRQIDISGLEYKNVDNSTFEAAFRYIYRCLFKPDKTTVRYNNKKTKINLRDIDEIDAIAEAYIDIIKAYNIIPYDKFFLEMTGIHPDTLNSWKNEEYSHGGLSKQYSEIYKKIHILPKEQVLNKLSGDRIGLQSLANNEPDVQLEYNNKRQIEEAKARQLDAEDVRKLLQTSTAGGHIEQKDEQTLDIV